MKRNSGSKCLNILTIYESKGAEFLKRSSHSENEDLPHERLSDLTN